MLCDFTIKLSKSKGCCVLTSLSLLLFSQQTCVGNTRSKWPSEANQPFRVLATSKSTASITITSIMTSRCALLLY